MGDPSPIVCGALCLLGAALLALPAVSWRRGALIAWAVVSLLVTLAPPTSRLLRGGEVREYTFAHYALGARYFAELGYTGLYDAAASAGVVPGVDQVRDLRTYSVGPSPRLRTHAPRGWTEARWEAFRTDLSALAPRQDGRSWRSWFRDKGFNATPAWTATFGRLLGARPVSPQWFALLGALDLLLLGLALVAAGRTFGGMPALATGASIALFYGSAQNLVAGPLQLDWIAALIGSACALQRGRMGLGGALLAWAALSRVFPAVLLAGPVIAAFKEPRLRAPLKRFAAGLGLVLLLGIGAGFTTGRGPGAWAEFAEKITTHSELHHEGDKRIGWRPLTAWAPVGDRTDAEARHDRRARWPQRSGLSALLALVLALGWGAALLRGLPRLRLDEPGRAALILLLLSLPLGFLALTMSRYYVLAPSLGLLLLGARHARLPAAFGIALLGSAGLVWFAIDGLPDATAYFVANGLWLALGLAVMGAWAAVRPR